MTATPWTTSDFSFSGDVLGTSAAANVVRATERATGQACAIKTYCLNRIVALRKLPQVRRALNLQWTCRHARVVGFYGWWLDPARPTPELYTVQELAGSPLQSPWAGMTWEVLAAKTGQHAAAELAVARYVRDVAVALHHLHIVRRVVHRDVRPANALRGADDRVRLGGFGCAAHVTDAEAMRGFCGRVDYVSPEMACSAGAPWRNRPEFAEWAAVEAQSHDFATDVWALGALAYYLLTGKPPLAHVASSEATQEVERAVAVLQAPLSLPPWLSADAGSFLVSLLQRDPAARPDIMRVLAHDWMLAAEQATGVGVGAAGAKRHVLNVATPGPPSGPDAAAHVEDVSVLDVYAACATIEAPMRTVVAPAQPATPLLQDGIAMQEGDPVQLRGLLSQGRGSPVPGSGGEHAETRKTAFARALQKVSGLSAFPDAEKVSKGRPGCKRREWVRK